MWMMAQSIVNPETIRLFFREETGEVDNRIQAQVLLPANERPRFDGGKSGI